MGSNLGFLNPKVRPSPFFFLFLFSENRGFGGENVALLCAVLCDVFVSGV